MPRDRQRFVKIILHILGYLYQYLRDAEVRLLNIIFDTESFIDELCVIPNPFGKFVTVTKYRGSRTNAMMLCEVTVVANLSTTDEVEISPGSVEYFIKNR